MSLKLKKKRIARIPPLEGGTYLAVCIGVVDIGRQYNTNFKKYADKLMLMFEVPSEIIEVEGEEKPRWLSREYTASLNEKAALYKHLVSWRSKMFSDDELSEDGNGFDIRSMLGQPCMLTVIVKDTEGGSYNRIENISSIPKGIPAPVTEAELLAFDIDERDEEVFGKLPEWIQSKIKKSTQYSDNPPVDNVDFEEMNENDANIPFKPEDAAEETEEECPI